MLPTYAHDVLIAQISKQSLSVNETEGRTPQCVQLSLKLPLLRHPPDEPVVFRYPALIDGRVFENAAGKRLVLGPPGPGNRFYTAFGLFHEALMLIHPPEHPLTADWFRAPDSESGRFVPSMSLRRRRYNAQGLNGVHPPGLVDTRTATDRRART